MFKSYLKIQFIAAAVLLICLAAFNFWADPYEYFGRGLGDQKGRLVEFPNRRTWANITINRVANGDYDTLFMGNSRIWRGLNPDHVAGRLKAYNASLSGCSIENICAVLPALLQKGRISTLLVGLDFSMARLPNDLTADGFSVAGLAESLLGLPTLKDSLVMLKRERLDSQPPRILPNGHWVDYPVHQTPQQHAGFLGYILGRLSSAARVPLDQGRGWSCLRDIIRQCRALDTKLIIVLPPVHAKLMEGLDARGYYPQYEAWVREVVDIAYSQDLGPASKAGTQVWTFCGYDDVTTDPLPLRPQDKDMRWFCEVIHFRPCVGDLIMDRVFGNNGAQVPADFGLLLTPENTDAWLEKMRAGLKAYLDKQKLLARKG